MRDQHLGKIRTFDGDDMTGKVFAYALMALLTIGSVTTLTPAMAQEGGPPDVLPDGGGDGDPAPEPEPEKKKEEPAPTPLTNTLTKGELFETNENITQYGAILSSKSNLTGKIKELIRHDGFQSTQQEIQPINPNDINQPNSLFDEALKLHTNGNPEKAVELYKLHLEQKPNDIIAQRLLADAQTLTLLTHIENELQPIDFSGHLYAPTNRQSYPSVLMQDYVLGYAPARQNEAFNAIEDNAVRTPSTATAVPKSQAAQKWDVWLSTSGSKAKISGSDGSSVGGGIGFNYLWNDRITLGLASRFNASENKSSSNVKSESKGWTLNPTASIKLTDDIVFGGSFAYGQTSTEVTKNGVKNADYDAQTYLVSGNLATEMNVQDWIFSPFASMSYYAQRREAYTDVANTNHSAKTSSLGQASIGSFVSRQFLLNETTALIPALGLSSTYIFKKIDPDADNFSARLDGGATLAIANGLSVSLQGYYDGIGRSNYEVYGGSIRGALKF